MTSKYSLPGMFALQSATCMHPLAAECFRNGSINCCWEQKVSPWHSLLKLEMEMFIFQHCRVTSNHLLHNFLFFFLQVWMTKFLDCSQPGSSWKDGGVHACVSWSSVCKQMSSMHRFDSGLPVKVFPNWDLLLNLVNFFGSYHCRQETEADGEKQGFLWIRLCWGVKQSKQLTAQAWYSVMKLEALPQIQINQQCSTLPPSQHYLYLQSAISATTSPGALPPAEMCHCSCGQSHPRGLGTRWGHGASPGPPTQGKLTGGSPWQQRILWKGCLKNSLCSFKKDMHCAETQTTSRHHLLRYGFPNASCRQMCFHSLAS